jgi:hypothetical protein
MHQQDKYQGLLMALGKQIFPRKKKASYLFHVYCAFFG